MSDQELTTCSVCGAVFAVEDPFLRGRCRACLLSAAKSPNADFTPETSGDDLKQIANLFPHLVLGDPVRRADGLLVLEAEEFDSQGSVLLILLKLSQDSDTRDMAQIDARARKWQALDHANVLSLRDYGELGAFFYLLTDHAQFLAEAIRTGEVARRDMVRLFPQIRLPSNMLAAKVCASMSIRIRYCWIRPATPSCQCSSSTGTSGLPLPSRA